MQLATSAPHTFCTAALPNPQGLRLKVTQIKELQEEAEDEVRRQQVGWRRPAHTATMIVGASGFHLLACTCKGAE